MTPQDRLNKEDSLFDQLMEEEIAGVTSSTETEKGLSENETVVENTTEFISQFEMTDQTTDEDGVVKEEEQAEPDPIETHSEPYIEGYKEARRSGFTYSHVVPKIVQRNGIATREATFGRATTTKDGGYDLLLHFSTNVNGAMLDSIREGVLRVIIVPEEHEIFTIDQAVDSLIDAIQNHR